MQVVWPRNTIYWSMLCMGDSYPSCFCVPKEWGIGVMHLSILSPSQARYGEEFNFWSQIPPSVGHKEYSNPHLEMFFFFFCIRLLASLIIKRLTLHWSHHLQIHINHYTNGRELNSAKSCDDGIVAITDAALPRCTSIAILWIKNWVALLSLVCPMTREPIRRTNKRAQDPQAPRVSTQRGEKWKVVVKKNISWSWPTLQSLPACWHLWRKLTH